MQDAAELPEIRAFIALADTGSFAAASRMLRRDATVLSRRLQSLEARLGVRLAERTTRRVTMTEAGRAYLARVRPLLLELESADREASSFVSGSPRGTLRVAFPRSFARSWLTPLMAEFLLENPLVRLEATYSDRAVDVIGEGFDLVVGVGDVRDSRLIVRKIGDPRRLVCAAPAYLAQRGVPLAPEDLPPHALLCLAGEAVVSRWNFRDGDGRIISISANFHVVSNDAELLAAAVVGGVGLYCTTDWHVGPELASGRLVEVLPAWSIMGVDTVYVMTSIESESTAKVRALELWLTEAIASQSWLSPTASGSIAAD